MELKPGIVIKMHKWMIPKGSSLLKRLFPCSILPHFDVSKYSKLPHRSILPHLFNIAPPAQIYQTDNSRIHVNWTKIATYGTLDISAFRYYWSSTMQR